MKKFCSFTALLIWLSGTLWAQTYEWKNSAGSTDWTDDANWNITGTSTGSGPGSNCDVVIDYTTGNTPTLTAASSAKTVILTNGTLNLNGNALTVDDGDFTQNGGLIYTGTLGSITVTDGEIEQTGGRIEGASATITASAGINLPETANLVPIISLQNTGATGNIRYNNNSGFVVDADNDASGGNIDISINNISTAYTLTVGTAGITADDGAITLTANNFSIGYDINAGDGKISIFNITGGRTFGLRGGAGTISFDGELAHLKAATLEIGRTSAPLAGNITVGTGTAFDGSVKTLVLRAKNTGAGVVNAGNIAVESLAIESYDPVNFTLDSTVANVAVTTNSTTSIGTGAINLTKSSGGFNVASIGGIDGLSCGNNGRITLNAGGAVTQSAPIVIPGAGTRSLLLQGAGPYTLLNGTNAVNTLAANLAGTGAALSFTNSGALTVGTVGATNGITTNGGNISLDAGAAYAITLAQDLSSAASPAGGNIEFDSPVVLSDNVSVSTVGGASGGNIIFGDTVNGAQNLSLTAGTGTITFAGAVGSTPLGTGTGAALTVASAGAVTVGSTFASASGLDISAAAISFANNVTIAAGNTATALKGPVSINGTGPLSISAGRDITFGNASTDTVSLAAVSGTVTIQTTANDGNIEFKGTVSGSRNLALVTHGTGTVTLNGNVTVGTGAASPYTALSVEAGAINFSGAPVITTDTNGNIKFKANGITTTVLCEIWAGGNPTPTGDLQITPRTIAQAIGYGPFISGFNANYDSSWGSNVHAKSVIIGDSAHTGNITIRGVTNTPYALSAVNSGSASITIEQDYTSNGKMLNLSPGSGGVILDGGVGTASINLGAAPFTVSGGLTLKDLTTGTITATGTGTDLSGTTRNGISLGAISVTGSGPHNLTLNSGSEPINVSGNVGSNSDRVGAITVDDAAGVTFTNPIYAASFTQAAGTGTTRFNGAQDYTGDFSFTGTNLMVAGTLTAAGDISIPSATDATFGSSSSHSVSAASFTQTLGSGTTTFNGTQNYTGDFSFTGTNLTVNNTLAAGDIAIPSATTVTFAAAATVSAASFTQTGTGSTTFHGTQTYTGDFSFTGTNLTVNNTLAAEDIAIPTANTVIFAAAATVNAASFTQSAGSGTTTFNGTQTYTGVNSAASPGPYAFQFSGNNLTIGNTLTTTHTGGDGGKVTIANNGAFNLNGTVTASGEFRQTTNTGSVSIGADIITNNGTAVIYFTDEVELTGNVIINSSSVGGTITLSNDVTSAANYTLTLNAGGGTVKANGSLGTSSLPLGEIIITGGQIDTNGINSSDKTSITNTGPFTSNAAIVSDGGFEQLASSTGSSTLKADIDTLNTLITFTQPITIAPLVTPLALNTSAGIGNITLAVVNGAGEDLTLAAGTGDIAVTGTVGTIADRLGDLKITSAANATFDDKIFAASFDQSGGSAITKFNGDQDYTAGFNFNGNILDVDNPLTAVGAIAISGTTNTVTFSSSVSAASFTQTGTGTAITTAFGGPQQYKEGFSFTGNSLTVNSTLETDTDTLGADGAIVVTVSGSGTPLFTVGGSGQILPGGTGGTLTVNGNIDNDGTISPSSVMTVNGDTGNAGTITAGNVTDPADPSAGGTPSTYAVDFNGDYMDTGTGSLVNANSQVFFAFRGASTVLGSAAPAAGWLVFLGNAPQGFDPNGIGIPNVLVFHADNITGVTVSGDAAQRGSYLVIRQGFLDLGGFGWNMNSSGGLTANTFTGTNGSLLLGGVASGTEARLIAQNINLNSGFTVGIIGSGKASLEASVNVFIDSGTALPSPLPNLTLNWTGGSGILTANREIGNLTLSGSTTGTLNLGAPLALAGDMTIGANKTLDVTNGSNYSITISGNWDQRGGSVFEPRNGTVKFAGSSTFEIRGNTTWYNFTCIEPGATLKFSNYANPGDCHTIKPGGTFTVKGGSGSGQSITLTRITNNGTPPKPPANTHKHMFWLFTLGEPAPAAPAKIDFNYVQIEYSWAEPRIVIPREDDSGNALNISANYHALPPQTDNLYDYRWVWNLGFVYAFTEDSNHNGKIDRIRMQSSVELDLSAASNWSNGFEVEVEGYEVTGVAELPDPSSPAYQDNIYVNVAEKNHSDGDARPRVQVTANASLYDQIQRKYLLGTVDPDTGILGWITATDTVVPRINYTLALPRGQGVFVQISEPITVITPAGITIVDGSLLGGTREFIIPFADPSELSLAVLAEGARKIAVSGWDTAEPAAVVEPGIEPQYPENAGNYSTYSVSPLDAGTGTGNGIRPPYPLVPTDYAPVSNTDPPPAASAEHRLTDLLVSVPPAAAADSRYFIWPAWAQNDDSTVFVGQDRLSPRPGELNVNGSPVPERGLIWNFTGRESLQIKGGLTFQVLQNGALNSAAALANETHNMVFAQNVGDQYLAAGAHGPEGLWLPLRGMSAAAPFRFLNLAPEFFAAETAADPVPVDVSASADRSIYNFSIPGAGLGPGMMDFYFHLAGSPADLYAARLDAAPGIIPEDWYRRVKPFRFNLRDLALQRGGVTILNNVIDPLKGERTFVHYHLVNGGRVTVQVFTLDGTLVQILQRGSQEAGEYDAVWDGKNRQGRPVARGMYFIRVVAPDMDEIRKVMVVK